MQPVLVQMETCSMLFFFSFFFWKGRRGSGVKILQDHLPLQEKKSGRQNVFVLWKHFFVGRISGRRKLVETISSS